VPQDDAQAVAWYRLSAEQGRADAQNNLAVMYDNGEGVTQDTAEALTWHRLAAEQGHAGAQYALGCTYATGQGVPQDYVQAHMWFNLSAAQGDEEALNNRDLAATLMTPADISEAERLARDWLEEHDQ
jgi:uncharacterized protein